VGKACAVYFNGQLGRRKHELKNGRNILKMAGNQKCVAYLQNVNYFIVA
jgi:hypothetical protein